MKSSNISRGQQRIPLNNNTELIIKVYDRLSMDTVVDTLARNVAYKVLHKQDLPSPLNAKLAKQLTGVTL